MAAVLAPAPSAPRPLVVRPGRPVRVDGRPDLCLIPGGRASAAMARTYRRRRVVVALALVTVLVVVLQLLQALTGVAAGFAAPGSAPIEGPVVVVEAEAGDTLWTVARQVHPTGDVRPVVEAMLAERGGAAVQVGDPVRVPAG